MMDDRSLIITEISSQCTRLAELLSYVAPPDRSALIDTLVAALKEAADEFSAARGRTGEAKP